VSDGETGSGPARLQNNHVGAGARDQTAAPQSCMKYCAHLASRLMRRHAAFMEPRFGQTSPTCGCTRWRCGSGGPADRGARVHGGGSPGLRRRTSTRPIARGPRRYAPNWPCSAARPAGVFAAIQGMTRARRRSRPWVRITGRKRVGVFVESRVRRPRDPQPGFTGVAYNIKARNATSWTTSASQDDGGAPRPSPEIC